MNRNLDGIYFRVKRDNEYQSICFSDLTQKEMKEVLKDKSAEFLKGICYRLGDVIKTIMIIKDDFSIQLYERLKTDSAYRNLFFSKLSEEEKVEMLQSKDVEWLKDLCYDLGKTLKILGEELDIQI